MKKLFIVVIFLIIQISCEKEPKLPPIDEVFKRPLPQATMEGKNTLGALINGEVWVSNEGEACFFCWGGVSVRIDVISTKDVYNFSIQGHRRNRVDTISDYITFAFLYDVKRNVFFEDTTRINMKKNVFIDNSNLYADFCEVENKENRFYSKIAENNINITKLDTINRIIAGTFNFPKAFNYCDDTLNISQGRFDLKF